MLQDGEVLDSEKSGMIGTETERLVWFCRKTLTNLGGSYRKAEARLPVVKKNIKEKGRFCRLRKNRLSQ